MLISFIFLKQKASKSLIGTAYVIFPLTEKHKQFGYATKGVLSRDIKIAIVFYATLSYFKR